MTRDGFIKYLRNEYPAEKSRAASSYLKAIDILDTIFLRKDIFGLEGKSLCLIEDIELLVRITDFVRSEEAKFRESEEGIFTLGSPTQKSYPKKRFCSAAMKSIINYYDFCLNKSAQQIVDNSRSAIQLSKKLSKHFDINSSSGEDIVREVKTRMGQSFFRKILLQNYNFKCSVTGLNVQKILRASHIVRWADDKQNRMNPENGILLSATYDAAFDEHLISFDEDYRMIVSKEIKEHYTNEAVKEYFEKFEGKQMLLPIRYLPSQKLLAKHRELLIV